MRPPTFTFEPYKVAAAKKESKKHFFFVSVKHGYITFPKSYIEEHKLNGRYIRWYLDTGRRALGWKILEKESDLSSLEEYFQLKPVPSSGIYHFAIRRLLTLFNFSDKNICFKDLEDQKYLSKTEFFNDGTIHYLLLDTPSPVVSRKKKDEITV